MPGPGRDPHADADPDTDPDPDGVPERQPDTGPDGAAGRRPGPVTETIVVTLAYDALPGRKSAKFGALRVRNVPLGSTVTVTCKGKGCPAGLKGKGFVKRNAFGAVNLKKFIKKPLRNGIAITVVVSKPNAISAVKILTVRKGKSPKITTRCIPPGSTGAVACN